MSLGQAFEDADEILTLSAIIPAMLIVLSLIANLGNQNLDTTVYMNAIVETLVQALIPSIKLIIVLGVVLYIYRQ